MRVGARESVIPVSFKTGRAIGALGWEVVRPRRRGGSPSVVQDDLDEAGHVRLLAVVQGEKGMLLHQKNGRARNRGV